MPVSLNIPNNKKQKYGVNILDQDEQPFATLPEGSTQSFVSNDETVATVEVEPASSEPGFTITFWVRTGKVGTCVITGSVDFPNDEAPAFSDEIAVAVQNSAAKSLGFVAIGDPVDE